MARPAPPAVGPPRPHQHPRAPRPTQYPRPGRPPRRQPPATPRTRHTTRGQPPLDRTHIGLYREHSASVRYPRPSRKLGQEINREGRCVPVIGTVPPPTNPRNYATPGNHLSVCRMPAYPCLVGIFRDGEQSAHPGSASTPEALPGGGHAVAQRLHRPSGDLAPTVQLHRVEPGAGYSCMVSWMVVPWVELLMWTWSQSCSASHRPLWNGWVDVQRGDYWVA
jgi:hypothetical protein